MFSRKSLEPFILDLIPRSRLTQPTWFYVGERARHLADQYHIAAALPGLKMNDFLDQAPGAFQTTSPRHASLADLQLNDIAERMAIPIENGIACRGIQYGAAYMHEAEKKIAPPVLQGLPRPNTGAMGERTLPIDNPSYAAEVATAAHVGHAIIHVANHINTSRTIQPMEDLPVIRDNFLEMREAIEAVKLRDNFVYKPDAFILTVTHIVGGLHPREEDEIRSWLIAPVRPGVNANPALTAAPITDTPH